MCKLLGCKIEGNEPSVNFQLCEGGTKEAHELTDERTVWRASCINPTIEWKGEEPTEEELKDILEKTMNMKLPENATKCVVPYKAPDPNDPSTNKVSKSAILRY